MLLALRSRSHVSIGVRFPASACVRPVYQSPARRAISVAGVPDGSAVLAPFRSSSSSRRSASIVRFFMDAATLPAVAAGCQKGAVLHVPGTRGTACGHVETSGPSSVAVSKRMSADHGHRGGDGGCQQWSTRLAAWWLTIPAHALFRSNGPSTMQPWRWNRSASTIRAPTVISLDPGAPIVARLWPASERVAGSGQRPSVPVPTPQATPRAETLHGVDQQGTSTLRSRCARSRRRLPYPQSGHRASSSSETRAPRSAARARASPRSTGTP